MDEVVLLVTMQTGASAKVDGKVTVQVLEAFEPVVTFPIHVPTIEGLVPQAETVATVPVAVMGALKIVVDERVVVEFIVRPPARV